MKFSEHFDAEEFRCHDGTPVPDELVPNAVGLCSLVLEKIRARWGDELVVVSGYRSPSYNAVLSEHSTGVAKDSTHMRAMAADIRPTKITRVHDLRKLVVGMVAAGELPDLGGLGEYPGWVHVDIFKAPDGHVRRWTGMGVAAEPSIT